MKMSTFRKKTEWQVATSDVLTSDLML